METETEVQISKKEIQTVIDLMTFYNRSEGFIDVREGKLVFFDSNPGDAAFITKEQLIESLSNP